MNGKTKKADVPTSGQNDLQSMLSLEQIDTDLFRAGKSSNTVTTRIFGGQVVAQALAAATATAGNVSCHSLHTYFLRPGDPTNPVIYHVERSKDGRSLTTRRVRAIQNGKQILNLSASYHIDEEGLSHQHAMPDVVEPSAAPAFRMPSREQYSKMNKGMPVVDELLRLIEMRSVNPLDVDNIVPTDDRHSVWFCIPSAKGLGREQQQQLLAYASDLNILSTSLRPHGLTWLDNKVQGASLDHAVWFHAPVQMDRWHLYALESPWTGQARCLNRGSIFSRDGNLVASVVQEGLIRPKNASLTPAQG
jgi:acyl-CoA thioesterase II